MAILTELFDTPPLSWSWGANSCPGGLWSAPSVAGGSLVTAPLSLLPPLHWGESLWGETAGSSEQEVLVKVKGVVGTMQIAALARAQGDGYGYGAFFDGSTLQLGKTRPSGGFSILGVSGAPVNPTLWYWLRLRVSGITLSAKIWQDGSPEPGAWSVTAADPTFAAGSCGVRFVETTGAPDTGSVDQVAAATAGETAAFNSIPPVTADLETTLEEITASLTGVVSPAGRLAATTESAAGHILAALPVVGSLATQTAPAQGTLVATAHPFGGLAATLDTVTAAFSGHTLAWGVEASLEDASGSFTAHYVMARGGITATLEEATAAFSGWNDISAMAMRNGWTPLTLCVLHGNNDPFTAYNLTGGEMTVNPEIWGLEPITDTRVPIANWQANLSTDEAGKTFVTVTIPDAVRWRATVLARAAAPFQWGVWTATRVGSFSIRQGFRSPDGQKEITEELMRLEIRDFRDDTGARSSSLVLAGFDRQTWPPQKTVPLSGVSYRRTDTDGKVTFRIKPDNRLRPGDTANWDGISIAVDRMSIQHGAGTGQVELSGYPV